jgi:crossover junction endodeoxyribonuclease RuvC
VAGYGNAAKEQMQLMVRALLGMSETPEPADAADALAVALCHMQAERFRARLAAGSARSAVEPESVRSLRVPRSRSATSRIS